MNFDPQIHPDLENFQVVLTFTGSKNSNYHILHFLFFLTICATERFINVFMSLSNGGFWRDSLEDNFSFYISRCTCKPLGQILHYFGSILARKIQL